MTEQHNWRAMRRIVDQLGFPEQPLPRRHKILLLQRPPLYPLMTVRWVSAGQYEIDYHSKDPS